jgi:energy-coupling factor transporter ATP-binding protein EcfA2
MSYDIKVKPLKTTFDDIKNSKEVEDFKLPKLHFKLLACGPSGSGKSTAVINLLNFAYKDAFKHVYLIGPTAKVDKVWDSLKISNFNKQSKKEKIGFHELETMFKKGLREIKTKGHTGNKTLIIFEDFVNTLDPDTGKLLLKTPQIADLTLVGRHAGISLVFLSQLFAKIPRAIRLNCSHIIFLSSKLSENERLADEFCPPRMNKKWMLQLISEITKPTAEDKFPFLFIDANAPNKYKFRQNFDQFVVWDHGDPESKKDNKVQK